MFAALLQLKLTVSMSGSIATSHALHFRSCWYATCLLLWPLLLLSLTLTLSMLLYMMCVRACTDSFVNACVHVCAWQCDSD